MRWYNRIDCFLPYKGYSFIYMYEWRVHPTVGVIQSLTFFLIEKEVIIDVLQNNRLLSNLLIRTSICIVYSHSILSVTPVLTSVYNFSLRLSIKKKKYINWHHNKSGSTGIPIHPIKSNGNISMWWAKSTTRNRDRRKIKIKID